MRASLISQAIAVLLAAPAAVVAKQWDVNVGKGGLVFDPPNLEGAQAGDTVTYHFFAKNHSVVQASFDKPCEPLSGGFYSGFVPSASPDTPATTDFTITVNDVSKPIWVYCAQTTGTHCQAGMVGSINAPATGNTLEAFAAAAKKTTNSIAPNFRSLPLAGSSNGVRTARVQVGSTTAPNLVFVPANLTEPIGTTVEFTFNPKNHSVVQSSFDKPCVPLAQGAPFFSGFIPVADTAVAGGKSSGSIFTIAVQSDAPLWFYCAQGNGNHCQSGMVGSINAPPTGNTFDAFVDLAKKASTPSQAPPKGPLTGRNSGALVINGNQIDDLGGNSLTPADGGNAGGNAGNGSAPPSNTFIPPPGMNMSTYLTGMAGGGPPQQIRWGNQIGDDTFQLLQLLQFVDNALIEVLWNGHRNLTTGKWSGMYPPVITRTLGSMSAQALVHRHTSTDCLNHFKKELVQPCKYSWPIQKVEDFVDTSQVLLALQIGLLLNIQQDIVDSEPWMVSQLGANLGAKARMNGVINMMQDRIAAAAPREVMLPPKLVYSYVKEKYTVKDSCSTKTKWDDGTFDPLNIDSQETDGSGRTTSIKVSNAVDNDNTWITWIGPWGVVQNSKLGKDGKADVPQGMSGYVWAVMTKEEKDFVQDVPGVTIAGPEVVWVAQPFSTE